MSAESSRKRSTNSPPFDPGDVVTTYTLDAYLDEGHPMLNNYIRHAKIGEGHHGEVYLCYQTNPGFPHGHPDRRIPVAMKSVKRDNARMNQLKKLRQQRLPASEHTPLADRLGSMEAKIRKEIAIMKKCRHPHVVRLYEIIDDRMRDKVYMVMEYLGGGEVKWRNEHEEPILTLAQTRRIIRDAVLGLEYLHHQGIIHRDIKPANLLWTQDRRQVKIADFGTSHFSYALLLAAGGGGGEGGVKHREDPILLDDSDLLRRDGTPKFMAPEIVYEHTIDAPAAMSMSVGDIGTEKEKGPSSLAYVPTSKSLTSAAPESTSTRGRPPITKAIDVWALGVTLYCLLFGRTPFEPDPAAGNSEWSLYNAIANHEWVVEETMGVEKAASGQTPQSEAGEEGKVIVKLLKRLLDKDPGTRITLEEVKRNEWILRDLADPETWLRLTKPWGRIDVTARDASVAMSSVHFRWNWGIVSRRISSLFRRTQGQQAQPRPQSSSPSSARRDRKFGVSSEPSVSVHSHSRSGRLDDRSCTRRVEQKEAKRDKGKQKQLQLVNKDKDKNHLLADGLDVWPPLVASSSSTPKAGAPSVSTTALQDPGSGSVSPTSVGGGGGLGRRGSVATVLGTGGGGGERHRNFSTGTNTNTASASSQSGSPVMEKPRSSGRFAMFLSSISHWRPGRYSPALSASSTSLGTGTTLTTPLSGSGTGVAMGRAMPGRGPGGKTMRSEEGLRYQHKKGAALGGGADEGGAGGGAGAMGMMGATALTSERRASSWGQGDQPVEFKGMDLSSYRLNPVCGPNFNGGRTWKEEEREGKGKALSSDGEHGLVSSSSSSSGAAVFIIGSADRNRRPLSMFPTEAATGAAVAVEDSPSVSSSLVRAGGVDAASVASGSRGDVESLGPACFDEDSSTIASAFGEHRQEEGEDEEGERPGSYARSCGGGSLHEDGDDFEEDSEDTDEVPVTFSPRKRAAPPVER